MLSKITEQELAENGVASAPDHLTGKAADNKKLFDKLIVAVIAPHLNRAIDALNKLEQDMGAADEELRQALRNHIEIDPSSVRDNNVSVSEEVIERLWLEGPNPTVKDALLWLQALIDQEYENLMASIEARAQVVSGTVTGSSKAGADSPNSITFPFEPKMVYVTKSKRLTNEDYSSMRYDSFLWVEGVTEDQVAAGVNRRYKLEGNTLSWWVDNTSYAGAVCGSYVAIG